MKKILILDKDQSYCDQITNMLNVFFETKSFVKPILFLESIVHDVPDIVIIGELKTEADVYSVIQSVRKIPDINITVIHTPVEETPENLEKSYDLGTSIFLTKDMVEEKLLNFVLESVSATKAQQEEKILVCEDSQLIRLTLTTWLQKNKYKIIQAHNGEEGYALAKEHQPSLIISDVEMPKMTGYQLCVKVKKDPDLMHIPVIILSSLSKKEEREKGLRMGAIAYLTKPCSFHDLMTLVERLLAEKRIWSKRERNIMLNSIKMMAKALEARDEYTRGHSERVSQISIKIARKMGMPHHQINILELAADMHDIGKIGIPDNVLLKPSKLTDEEYDIIKTHPLKGVNILAQEESMEDICEIIQSHHERIDGRGYPKGLKDGEIPLGAKIVAVADTWDALTSNRPYRNGLPQEKAIEILKDASGTQLDDECVQVFLNLLSENLI